MEIIIPIKKKKKMVKKEDAANFILIYRDI